MATRKIKLNPEVTLFLDGLSHPLRNEIEQLRAEILKAAPSLTENIKWNGPNYHREGEDRITMKIFPPRSLQLILHRGAKPLPQPAAPLIQDDSGLLSWKGNDRAVITFRKGEDIQSAGKTLSDIIRDWLGATG